MQRNVAQPKKQGITEAAMNSWISFIDVAPDTRRTYETGVRRLVRFLKDNEITQPTRADLVAYREELRSRYAPATVQGYVSAARLFFRWTQDAGIYPNIAEHLKGAKITPGHKRDYLTPEQLRSVLSGIDAQTAAGKRDYAIIALMAVCGIRDIEAHRANVADLGAVGGAAALWIQGKGREEKSEFVKIPAPVERALLDYLRTRGSPEENAPLFSSLSSNYRGERLSRRSISGIVKERIKAAGIDSERITAHSLRHTAITLALMGGATLQEAQQFARHRALTTTQIYAHNLDRLANPCEQIISDTIFTRTP